MNPAETIDTPFEPASVQQFLTFHVDAQEYGVDIMTVREIRAWAEPTRLPYTPTYVRGIINLRGNMVPVFDLRARLGGEFTKAGAYHVVIVVAIGAQLAGILADAVSDILTADSHVIQPAPETSWGALSSCIHRMLALEDRLVLLLHAGQLFREVLAPSDMEAAL